MVSNSNQVMNSAYEVPLEYAISKKDSDGHVLSGYDVPHCYQLCTKTWSQAQIVKFQSMVNAGYGYRMYLDDLPSATVFEHKPYYDAHIPLGYFNTMWLKVRQAMRNVPGLSEVSSPDEKPAVYIYNHLDIVVTVHETALSENGPSTLTSEKVTLEFGDLKFKVDLP